MDKITLQGIEAHGKHGVYPEEKANGQLYYVTAHFFWDTSRASVSDELQDTVDYSELAEVIISTIETQSYSLIETLATQIISALFKHSPKICRIILELTKPTPPHPKYSWAGTQIQITRTRDDFNL
ncbi:MAG: dihydroneopterin aldolase [Opitutales bacterium]